MTEIKLKPGVVVEKNSSGHWYIVDYNHYQAHAIPPTIASVITGDVRFIHGDTNDEKQAIMEELYDLGLSLDSPDSNAKKGFSAGELMFFDKLSFKPSHALLVQMLWLYRLLTHRIAVVMLIVALALGLFMLQGQWTYFLEYYQVHSMSLTDYTFISIAFVIATAFHELGHALAIVKAQGQVKRFGVTFIAGSPTPMPFTEPVLIHKATRTEKMMIGASGLWFEMWIVLITLFLWLGTDEGALRTVAGFILTVRLPLAVGSIMIPFIKMDGYHIMSAWFDNPWLYEQGVERFKDAINRIIFDIKEPINPDHDAILLLMYGAGVAIFRLSLVSGLCMGLIFLAGDRLGLILSVMPIYLMLYRPLKKYVIEVMQMKTNHPFNRVRLATTGVVATTVLMWLTLPIPHATKQPFFVDTETYTVVAPTSGNITFIKPYGEVKQGEIVAKLTEPYLNVQRAETTTKTLDLNYAETNRLVAVAQKKNVQQQLKIDSDERRLTITAPSDGIWKPEPNRDGQLSVSDSIGRIFTDQSSIVGMMPSDIDEPQITGWIQAANRPLHSITLRKTSTVIDPTSIPQWVQTSDSRPALFVADWNGDLIDGWFVYEENYSILGRLLNKLLTRFQLLV